MARNAGSRTYFDKCLLFSISLGAVAFSLSLQSIETQAQKFWNATNRRMERWRDGRDAAKTELESGDSLSAHDKRELERVCG